ncbi:hypothetical protein JCM10908_003494 [Rhodotorula pacifica]|uniref:Zn(II)2Cys6 transcription factor n=1 Tax=Rhodotorula pacifica TaxID=1495444 RepID=UPI0031718B60
MLNRRRSETEPRKAVSSTTESQRRSRTNATRACAPCRRRKSKCDGGNPCSTCNLYHDECSYSVDTDGRKPPARHYVAALEERIKVLEGMLNGPAMDEDGDGADESTAAGLDRLKLDEETCEFLQYGPTSAFQHLGEPSGMPTSPGSADDARLSRSPVASLPRTVGSFLDGRSSSTPSGPLEWSRYLPGHLAREWDESLHDDLLKRFFTYFNSWCYWVDETAFRHDLALCLCASSSSSPPRTSNYSPLLHNALLSLAVSFSDDPRILSDKTALSEALATRAKSEIEREGERPTLATLQGLLLIGSHGSGSGRQGLGYIYSGIALRMLHTLGLGIDCSSYVERGILSEEVRSARDRTLFLAYIQDKLWSAYVGRNPSVLRAQLEPPLPAIDRELDRQPWCPLPADVSSDSPPKPTPSYLSSTFHHTCRLAIVEERIMTTVYALRVNLQSPVLINRISELNVELETWFASLPAELRIAPQTSRPPAPHIIMVNCYYHFCSILLHRPFPQNESAIKRCTTAATRIVGLFELYQRCPGLRFAPISATQFAFAAATTHLLALVTTDASIHGRRAEDARHGTEACGRILREMGRAHACALQTATIFEGLVQKWCPPHTDLQSPPPPATIASPVAPPTISAAQQALDPDSELAKTLLKLGWTPPTSVAPAAPPAFAVPSPAPPPLASLGVETFPQTPSGPSMSMPPSFQQQGPHSMPFQYPPYSNTPLWPFFAPTAPHPPPIPNNGPLSDDVLASLLSTEGRGATDYGAGSNFPFWGGGYPGVQ